MIVRLAHVVGDSPPPLHESITQTVALLTCHRVLRQVRYKTMAPSILLQDETEFSATTEGGLATKTFSGADLDNDVDVSGLAEDASVTIW